MYKKVSINANKMGKAQIITAFINFRLVLDTAAPFNFVYILYYISTFCDFQSVCEIKS